MMAYDELLADRVLAEAEVLPDITTRKMFGGFAVMWHGNMLAGVVGDDLMLRVGSDRHDALVAEPGARVMDFAGKPMRGMLLVSPEAVADPAQLSRWIHRAQQFVGTLPPK